MTTQQQAETSVLAHKVWTRGVGVGFEAAKLILMATQTLQFEWVVQETATLLEKAKLRQSHSVTVSHSRV